MLNYSICILASLLLFFHVGHGSMPAQSDELPIGYIQQYSLAISKNTSYYLNHSTDTAWRSKAGANYQLHLQNHSIANTSKNYQFALLYNMVLGDFIWKGTVRIPSAQQANFVVAMRDTNNYYLIELMPDSLRICKIYGGAETLITKTLVPLSARKDKVQFSISRDILTRTVKVIVNGFETEFTDSDLVMGYIGFAIRNSSLTIHNLQVWGPTSIEKEIDFLDKKL